MIINNVPFFVELSDILQELQTQLSINHIPLLQRMKDSGDDIMVSCPYHKGGQERRPSAGIRKSDGLFHCLACGETHSLQEVISHCFGYTDDLLGAFGWKWLNKNFTTATLEVRKDVKIDFSRNNITNKNDISDDCNSNSYITEAELDSYRYIHPYMFKRKLTEPVIELFDIGYDKNTDCITFPVRDIKGNCLFVARRSVKYKYFNYPKGVEKPVYGLYELSKYWYGEYNIEVSDESGFLHDIREHAEPWISEVIVCESMLDALTCWVYGKYAVALNGLGNERQFRELRDMPCRKLILATDADGAGMRARQRIRNNVKNKLITEYVWDKNTAKDINDMSKEMFDKLEEVF